MAKPDYHNRPNANVRVDAGLLAWARDEAKRRGQPFGEFMGALIAAERDRVTAPPSLVAAIKEQPRANAKRANTPSAREPESTSDIMAALRRRNGGPQ